MDIKDTDFFNNADKKLPIVNYEQVNQTIIYDSKLKNLLYGKIMYIETALKNISLDTIINEINSSDINDMYREVIQSYANSPANSTPKQKEELQSKFFSLQNMIHRNISNAYNKKDKRITHFYNNSLYSSIPLWAVFEIITMGDFGELLSRLTFDMRDKISTKIGYRKSVDTNRELLYKYVYTLKDLRNAIAHNEVVYDVRFRKIDPSNAMKMCLIQEIGLPYVDFKDIIDYIALIVYILKLLKVNKTEQRVFLNSFEEYTNDYILAVGKDISDITINRNWKYRLKTIREYL